MQISNFTKGIYLFVARNLRRIADYLEVISRSAKVESGVDKTRPFKNKGSRPPEDWLKRAEGIPPENWLEFSAENTAEFSVATREDATEKVLSEEQSKTKRVETSNANDDPSVPDIKVESVKNKENKSRTKVKRSKSIRERFLKFHSEDQNQPSEIEKFSKPDNKTPKPDFKLQPTNFVFGKENKLTETFDSSEVEYKQEKESSPILKEEKKTFASKRVVSDDVRQIPKKQSPSSESSSSVYKPVQSFEHSDIKESVSIYFQPEIVVRKQPKMSRFETSAALNSNQKTITKSENDLNEKNKKEYSQNTRNASEIAFSDTFQQFWIELPDETAYEAIDEIEINRVETEHLQFLEEEQAGKFE